MSTPSAPPFRAEHIGSLLRPKELLGLRRQYARGEIDSAALTKAIRRHFTSFDLVEGDSDVALALRWLGAPSYERIAAFAKGIRDAARTADGGFLYALDADARQVFGWSIERDGRLVPAGAVDGLPATAAGLAAL